MTPLSPKLVTTDIVFFFFFAKNLTVKKMTPFLSNIVIIETLSILNSQFSILYKLPRRLAPAPLQNLKGIVHPLPPPAGNIGTHRIKPVVKTTG